ncbi:MAG TPA: transaldolase family protein [Methylomirabilota bacterium]|jgi:transaldolase|nr:transaldolase family protein [Methylomirabilota bacterium]
MSPCDPPGDRLVIDGTFASFDEALMTCGRGSASAEHPRLEPSALLAALREAGTAHVYADTADREELRAAIGTPAGGILAEVDGNTVNQPLVRHVLDRYLAGGRLAACARELRGHRPELDGDALRPYLYTMVCGWIGSDVVSAFAAGRPWEVSLQLHMGATSDPGLAKVLARSLRRMVPSCFVKVPFRPQEPHALLVARDLEDEGIPVNFTSTFSARQGVAAALLADVTRTNIFMGRLNQGLRAAVLGEHVVLETQRALRRLRRDAGVKTHLIVASMREWQTFPRVAGSDVFTAPCSVLRDFLAQTEVPPAALRSQLDTSYEEQLGIAAEATQALGTERIARLWRVEPEFVEFLRSYRATAEYRGLRDGERLWRRFEEAGYGDFFCAPDRAEWATLRTSKLPDLDSPLTARLALDTHYSLLADGDFVGHQDAIDGELGGQAGQPSAAEGDRSARRTA